MTVNETVLSFDLVDLIARVPGPWSLPRAAGTPHSPRRRRRRVQGCRVPQLVPVEKLPQA